MLGCTFTPLRGNRYRVNPGGPVLKKSQLDAYRMALYNRSRPTLPSIVIVTGARTAPMPAMRRRAYRVQLDWIGFANFECRDCFREYSVSRSDSFTCSCGARIGVTAVPYTPPAGYDLSRMGLKELAVEIADMANSFKCPACGQGNSFVDDEGTVNCMACRMPIKVTRRARRRAYAL